MKWRNHAPDAWFFARKEMKKTGLTWDHFFLLNLVVGALLALDLALLVSLIAGTHDEQPPLPQHEAAVNAKSPQRRSVLHLLSQPSPLAIG
jgi:hypothetical protein